MCRRSYTIAELLSELNKFKEDDRIILDFDKDAYCNNTKHLLTPSRKIEVMKDGRIIIELTDIPTYKDMFKYFTNLKNPQYFINFLSNFNKNLIVQFKLKSELCDKQWHHPQLTGNCVTEYMEYGNIIHIKFDECHLEWG